MPIPIEAPPVHTGQMGGDSSVDDHLKLQLLVRAYAVRGHRIAMLDPLDIINAERDGLAPPELTIEHYGWSEKDLDREFGRYGKLDRVCYVLELR